MEQEYRPTQMHQHKAKKRIYQDRGDPFFQDDIDPDYDVNYKKPKFISLSGADFKIGPIFLNQNYTLLEEDPQMITQYCNPNFQPVSVEESENERLIQNKWQNRMESQYYTDDKRKWLEHKKKIIENEMYFYRRQQKSFETRENDLEYYK